MIETSDEQKILLTNLKRVVKDKIAPVAGETDIKGTFNWDVVSLFWDLGLLQIMLPEAYGGWPHNPCHTLCLSIEEISKAPVRPQRSCWSFRRLAAFLLSQLPINNKKKNISQGFPGAGN